MKRVLLFLMLFSTTSVFAQDVIVKKDGSTILSKVIEIGTTEIKYKKNSNLNGPTYSINIADVQAVNYENGEKENFSGTMVSQPQQNVTIPQQSYGYQSSKYQFDDKQFLLEKSKRIKRTANILDGIAIPLGLAVGLGGAFLLDASWMIWVGLGVEVTDLIISSAVRAHANRIEEKAYYYSLINPIVSTDIAFVNFNIGQNKVSSGLQLLTDTHNKTHAIGLGIDFSF